MKIVNGILGILFLLFAGWQFNDPDPIVWMTIYGFTAFICIVSIWKPLNNKVIFAGMMILFIYALVLLPGVIDWWNSGEQDTILEGMDRTKPYLEETREFFGLMIAIVGIKVNWLYNWRVRSKS